MHGRIGKNFECLAEWLLHRNLEEYYLLFLLCSQTPKAKCKACKTRAASSQNADQAAGRPPGRWLGKPAPFSHR